MVYHFIFSMYVNTIACSIFKYTNAALLNIDWIDLYYISLKTTMIKVLQRKKMYKNSPVHM